MGGAESKPSIQEVLHHFVNNISANLDYIRDGNVVANEVFNILRSQRNDVDRVIVAGSIGKRTAVGDCSDFDVVIFLNYKEPPFATTLSEIRGILERNKSKLKNYRFLNQTDMFISFKVSGYQFDLSPTANYKGWFADQKGETWKKVKQLPDPIADGRLYSPGLAEYSVDFLKQQSAFVHSIIRLAKYWNANIDVGRCYIGGRSLMMELLAIKACEKISKNDVYLAFKQFLTDITSFDDQIIYFENYYNKSEIPRQMFLYRIGPVILDPVNYYNNLGDRRNISERAVAIFERAAYNSLAQLERWIQDPHSTADSFRRSGIFYDDDYNDQTFDVRYDD